jgi:hypothetical protein
MLTLAPPLAGPAFFSTPRCGLQVTPTMHAASRASDESLRRRLELAHHKITQLRAENQQLRHDLAAAHGQLRAAAASREGTRW